MVPAKGCTIPDYSMFCSVAQVGERPCCSFVFLASLACYLYLGCNALVLGSLCMLMLEWIYSCCVQNGAVVCATGKLKDQEGENDKEADAEETKLKPGHLPVTDWRVFDQRFLGYYTWLEPPLQPTALKCANCGIQCIKVHRCAAAYIFLFILSMYCPSRTQ